MKKVNRIVVVVLLSMIAVSSVIARCSTLPLSCGSY